MWKISLSLVLAASAVCAQTPAPAFEVASIKPATLPTAAQVTSGKLHIGMAIDGARVDIGNLPLAELIRIAYRVKPYQISGPDWMGAERFDVLAKIPEGVSREQVPEMLQALLAERFRMTVHRENKEHAMYALVVGKNGPKLKESAPDADSNGAAGNAQVRVSPNGDGKGVMVRGGQTGPARMSMGPGGTMHLELAQATPAMLADMLGRFVDRPVVDMTELKGTYQVALDLSMDDLRNAARAAGVTMPGLAAGGEPGRPPGAEAAPAASDPSGGSIFNAVQQLGLKLEPRKAPIEVIVIDHLEKAPTEN
jgi:uncharacterized protein (TIGR03435 family)